MSTWHRNEQGFFFCFAQALISSFVARPFVCELASVRYLAGNTNTHPSIHFAVMSTQEQRQFSSVCRSFPAVCTFIHSVSFDHFSNKLSERVHLHLCFLFFFLNHVYSREYQPSWFYSSGFITELLIFCSNLQASNCFLTAVFSPFHPSHCFSSLQFLFAVQIQVAFINGDLH